jgi:hypothetical protein
MSARALVLLTVAMTMAAAPRPASAQAPPACDRACLTTVLNQFLDAMQKHDPKLAPLAKEFRYTENAEVVAPPEGVWKTISGLGSVQRRYVDPVSGQAVYFGHLTEGEAVNIASLRIRVVDKMVTEGELVVGRKADLTFDADGLTKNPPPQGPVAKEKRSSRQALLAAARSYFDGIHHWDSARVLFHPGCVRIENGQSMTGRPIANAAPGGPTTGDCANNLSVFKATIAGVVARRFPVVDEEAGVVFGTAVFNRPPGAKRQDGSIYPRNLLTELFVIENDRIRGIWAAMHYMTPDVRNAPNW